MPKPGERDALRDWHRLFGLLLTDYFAGLPFVIEIERDLSQQQQFLDVVIVRREGGRLTFRLPDGLDDLANHNLITFKSHHEALDSWAMKELIGHYVAYRKLISPSPKELLPEEHFHLYAVCARFPAGLSAQAPWRERQPGVYHCQWGTDQVTVIVAGQLPEQPNNAPLHLFSASPALVGFGQTAYRMRSERTSRLVRQLLERFQGEGFTMAYTMADFERDYAKEHFKKLSPDERVALYRELPRKKRSEMLEALLPDERRELLELLPPEERRELLKSLPPEERRELLESLPPEERLAGLSAEQIQHYLDQLNAGARSAPKPKRKK